jgi:hypothetical protein
MSDAIHPCLLVAFEEGVYNRDVVINFLEGEAVLRGRKNRLANKRRVGGIRLVRRVGTRRESKWKSVILFFVRKRTYRSRRGNKVDNWTVWCAYRR